MSNTFKVPLVGISIFLFTLLSQAAPTVTSAEEISRAVWLEQVRGAASVPICKSFIEDESISAQMKSKNMSYENCVSLIPAIAEKCEKKFETSIPATINDENADKWGKLIGECIGNDFAMSYLYPDPLEATHQ